VTRETPFGEPGSKRSLYRIADPFFRLWFRVVAPNRGPLAIMTSRARRALLAKHWPSLLGEAWEQLCRESVSRLGEWSIASRWWRGTDPEWDVVAESLDRSKLLLGEVKVRASQRDMEDLVRRPHPPFAEGRTVVKALFAAHPPRGRSRAAGTLLVGPRDVFARR